MEQILTKYSPKRLSVQAHDFLMFAKSKEMRKETSSLTNKVAYILKQYSKANEIKATTARNWFNKYEVVNGFVIDKEHYSSLNDDLQKINLTINEDKEIVPLLSAQKSLVIKPKKEVSLNQQNNKMIFKDFTKADINPSSKCVLDKVGDLKLQLGHNNSIAFHHKKATCGNLTVHRFEMRL